jgi:uncharacterized membrane protein
MTEAIVEFFNSVTHNDYLTLYIISLIPVVELRGAIIVMSGMPEVNMPAGMLCCIAGSTTVILPVMFVVKPLIERMKRSKGFKRIGIWLEQTITSRTKAARVIKKTMMGNPEEQAGYSALNADVNNSAQGGWKNDKPSVLRGDVRNGLETDKLSRYKDERNISCDDKKNEVGLNSKRIDGRFFKSFDENSSAQKSLTAFGKDSLSASRTSGSALGGVKCGSLIKRFLFLFGYVAVPLPLTGAWSGSCIGAFMGIKLWQSALAVFLGNIAAAAILTAAVYLLPAKYADYFLYAFAILVVAAGAVFYFSKLIISKGKRRLERKTDKKA